MGGLFDKTAWRAGRQHGRIARRQLLAIGVEPWRIEAWLADGRLRRVHRGVYAVGHEAPTVLGDYMAAVLACGDGTRLSHRAAAHLLRLLKGAAPPPEVTVPTLAGRARPGIVVHRVKALHVDDTSDFEGIPITTVPRILLDLAPSLSPEQLTRACHEAWVRHDTEPGWIEACIDRNPAKKGAAKLRAALGTDATLSKLEDAFVELLRSHGLAAPRTNVDYAGDKVDCHWPALGLTVELVSFRFHASRRGFEADVARRRRSGHLAFSYGDVIERGERTIAELVAAMTSAARRGPASTAGD
jgi:predicted transcriptional regulator of viral defense system